MADATPPPVTITPRHRRVVVAWAVTLGVLLAATWRLWTPLREVPRVTPFAWQEAIPVGIDWGLLLLIAGALFWAVRSCKALSSLAVLIATAGLLELMSLDQLRWQPWAYHAALAGAILGLAPPQQALSSLRWLAVAAYAFSAVAKIDAEFAATLGQQMLGVFLGEGLADLDASTRTGLALALPVGELVLASLLTLSRWSRRLAKVACILAALMHAVTIATLSPWGLGHSLGVLLWNAGFAWQTIVLFWPEAVTEEPIQSKPASLLATAALLIGTIAPLGTPIGLWDQWPGWALYSPGGERASLFVHSSSLDALPASLLLHADSSDQSEGPWRRVRVDDWVLNETGAPIYPQNRVVAALAIGLYDRGVSTNHIRVISESAANRLTRDRTRWTFDSPVKAARESRLLGNVPTVIWTTSPASRVADESSGGR